MQTQITKIQLLYNELGESELLITTKKNLSAEIQQIKDLLNNGKVVDCEIKEHRVKRSLDANAYLWVLCDKIAQQLKTTKEDVYREFIKDYGVFEIVPIKEAVVDVFCKKWQDKGVGWCCINLGSSKLKNYVNIQICFGSSVYDSKEMSRVLEAIVEQAKELGIETIPPAELERLNKEWGDRYGKHNSK